MMEEYRFDAEAINELLSWAEQVLKDDSLPKGEYQLSKSDVISDCRKYVEVLAERTRVHRDNPVYRPYIRQLYQFREKIEMQQ